jgi:hypothetical protein
MIFRSLLGEDIFHNIKMCRLLLFYKMWRAFTSSRDFDKELRLIFFIVIFSVINKKCLFCYVSIVEVDGISILKHHIFTLDLFDKSRFTCVPGVQIINIELTGCSHGPRRISRWKMNDWSTVPPYYYPREIR